MPSGHCQLHTQPRNTLNWVAVKELIFRCYIGGTILFTLYIYTHDGNLISLSSLAATSRPCTLSLLQSRKLSGWRFNFWCSGSGVCRPFPGTIQRPTPQPLSLLCIEGLRVFGLACNPGCVQFSRTDLLSRSMSNGKAPLDLQNTSGRSNKISTKFSPKP